MSWNLTVEGDARTVNETLLKEIDFTRSMGARGVVDAVSNILYKYRGTEMHFRVETHGHLDDATGGTASLNITVSPAKET